MSMHMLARILELADSDVKVNIFFEVNSFDQEQNASYTDSIIPISLLYRLSQ